ncbi:C2H2-type domain-containing protein [Fusarium sp. Ph1]|nr:C2H2-type domain-containing protein [Fusarium sp. Ph1]
MARPSRPRANSGAYREKFIAIGIDFGTTFSGVSWAFSEDPDNIHEISEWPTANHINQGEVQVPSLYDIDSEKWGYQVAPDMMPVKWFKLLLLNDSDLAKEDINLSKRLRQSRKELSEHPSKISAVNIVGRYLGKLWDHAQTILRTKLDIDGMSLRVAITVPAIWPHYAQKAMRKAADLAGITARRPMGAPTLELIHEPEAASLSIMLERSLLPEIKPGECFVVCDAGGGTVDVISYQVISSQPFRLKECVKGEGGLFGAVRIDEAFEIHLWGRDRLKLNSLSLSEYNTLVVEDWERGVKRTFTNQEQPIQFSLRLPLKAYKTRDRWRNKDHFSLNRSEVQGFFDKSLTGIRALVSEQRKRVETETGKLPKNILLVGGLGSSLHVYGVLNEVFDETVLRPINGWSAVARGAVIRLLQDKLSVQQTLSEIQKEVLATLPDVTARKSRYSYGICLSVAIDQLRDYDENLDIAARDPEGDLVAPRMVWYLRKGEEVSGKSPLTVPFWRYYKAPIPKKCICTIRYSPDDPPPKRPDPAVEELCTIECAFDTDFSKWEPVGDPDKGYRRWEFRVGSQQATADARVEYMEKDQR